MENASLPGKNSPVLAQQVGLCVLAAASCAVYFGGFTLPMWLPTYYRVPFLDLPKIVGVSHQSADRFSLEIGLLFVLYVAALSLTRYLRPGRSVVLVLGLAATISLSAIPMYPAAAGDLFAYMAEADVVRQFHANPFLVPVANFPESPVLAYVDFPEETTHYGPLWLGISVTLRLLSAGNLMASLLLFKSVASLLMLATAWIAYLKLRDTRPGAAVPAALLISWNPLLVFELAGNGHNDVAMMLFVGAAFYLYARGRPRLAVTSLLAAALIKYVATLLLPLFLIAMMRRAGPIRMWLPHAVAYAGGAGIAIAAIVAVVSVPGTLGVLERQSRWFTTSPTTVAYLWLSKTVAEETAAQIASLGGQGLFALSYLLALVWVWRRPLNLAAASFCSILAFLLLAVSWFQPWYVAWVLPLAALAASPLAFAVAVALSAGAFLTHSVMGFEWRLNYGIVSELRMHAEGAMTAWLPPLVAGLMVALWRLRSLALLRRLTH